MIKNQRPWIEATKVFTALVLAVSALLSSGCGKKGGDDGIFLPFMFSLGGNTGPSGCPRPFHYIAVQNTNVNGIDTDQVYASSNGSCWEAITTNFNDFNDNVQYTNWRTFSFGGSSYVIAYSPTSPITNVHLLKSVDGGTTFNDVTPASWAALLSNADSLYVNVAGNNVYLTYHVIPASLQHVKSSDLTNWISDGTLPDFYYLVYEDAGTAYRVNIPGNPSCPIYQYSTNGTSWSTPASCFLPVGLTLNASAVSYQNQVVFLPTTGSTLFYSTDNGANMSSQIVGAGSFIPGKVVFGNGKFLTFDNSSGNGCANVAAPDCLYYSSADGLSWTPNHIPEACSNDLVFLGGRFMTTHCVSDDGVTWVRKPGGGSPDNILYIP